MAYNFTNSNDISKFVKDNIKDYLNNKKNYTYKKYVEYLEKVVELNPRDLDMELNLSKFDSILKDASPEVREAFLSKYRN